MHSSRFVSWGFLLLAINIPPQFTDEKSNDSSMREWMPLDALNWFGRGNELHTPLPTAFRLSRVGWLRVLAFRSVYYPWRNIGTTCSLCFLSFTEANRWTCLNSICTLSSGSQMLKHVLNYRPFYLFYLFFFLESRISQLMSQYWKLLSGVSAIYHSNFTLWPLGNVILKQNWVGMKAS